MSFPRPSSVQEVRETLRRILKNLECPICLELLSDPYSTQCSHPFCRACIYTVISSSKEARCPLCKEPISKRSMNRNSRLAEIVEAVKALEQAVIKDAGDQSTPPHPLPSSNGEASGMSGHSILHPTPRKPSSEVLKSSGEVGVAMGLSGEVGVASASDQVSERQDVPGPSVAMVNSARGQPAMPPQPFVPRVLHKKSVRFVDPSWRRMSGRTKPGGEGGLDVSRQTALLQALEQATFVEPASPGCRWVESGDVVREEMDVDKEEGGQGQLASPVRKKPKRDDWLSSVPVTLSILENAQTSSSVTLATCSSPAMLTPSVQQGQSQLMAFPPPPPPPPPSPSPLAVDSRVCEVAETPFLQHHSLQSSPKGPHPHTEMSTGSLTVCEVPCERSVALQDQPSTSGLVADRRGETPQFTQTTVSDLLSESGDVRTESEIVLAEDTPLQEDVLLPEAMTRTPHPLATIAETQLPVGSYEESTENSSVPEGETDSGVAEAGAIMATPPSSMTASQPRPTEGQTGQTCLSPDTTPLLGQGSGEMRTIAETQFTHVTTQPQTSPDVVPLQSAGSDGECPTGGASPVHDADSTISLSPPNHRREHPRHYPPSSSSLPTCVHPSHRPPSTSQNAPGYASGNDTTPDLVSPGDVGLPTAPKGSVLPEGAQPKLLPSPPQLPNMEVTSSLSRLISPCIPLQNILSYTTAIAMATSSGNERRVIPDSFAASRADPSATPTQAQAGHTPIPSSQKTPFAPSLPPRDSALPGLHTVHALRAAATQESPLPHSRQSVEKAPTPPHPPCDPVQPPTSGTPSGAAVCRQQPAFPSTDGLTTGSVTVIPDSVALSDSGPSGTIASSPSRLTGVEKSGCGVVGVASPFPSPSHTVEQSVGSCTCTQTGGYSQWDDTARSTQYELTTQQLEALRDKMEEKRREVLALEQALATAGTNTAQTKVSESTTTAHHTEATPTPHPSAVPSPPEGITVDLGSRAAPVTITRQGDISSACIGSPTQATPTHQGKSASSQSTTASSPEVEVIAETIPDSLPRAVSCDPTQQSNSSGRGPTTSHQTSDSTGVRPGHTSLTGSVDADETADSDPSCSGICDKEGSVSVPPSSISTEERKGLLTQAGKQYIDSCTTPLQLARKNSQSVKASPVFDGGSVSSLRGRPKVRVSQVKGQPLTPKASTSESIGKAHKGPKVTSKPHPALYSRDRLLSPTVGSGHLSSEEVYRNQLLAKADRLIKALRSPPPVFTERQTTMDVDQSLLVATPPLPSHDKTVTKSQLAPTSKSGLRTNKSPLLSSGITSLPTFSRAPAPPSTQSPPRKRRKAPLQVLLGSEDVETDSPPSLPDGPLPENHPFLSITTNQQLAGCDTMAPVGDTRTDPASYSLSGPAPQTSNQTASNRREGEVPRGSSVVETPRAQLSGEVVAIEGSLSSVPSFVGSGLSKPQLKQAQTLARRFGGRIATCFNGSTTHVIVMADEKGCCPRTIKYLQGLAAGRWIVDYKWVKDSLQAGRLLSEDPYEVLGDHVFNCKAPLQARMARADGCPGLFDRHNFRLIGGFASTSIDHLAQLVQLGGGAVVADLNDYLPPVGTQTMVVCDRANDALRQCLSRSGGAYSAVTSGWILDSLSEYRLQLVNDYQPANADPLN